MSTLSYSRQDGGRNCLTHSVSLKHVASFGFDEAERPIQPGVDLCPYVHLESPPVTPFVA